MWLITGSRGNCPVGGFGRFFMCPHTGPVNGPFPNFTRFYFSHMKRVSTVIVDKCMNHSRIRTPFFIPVFLATAEHSYTPRTLPLFSPRHPSLVSLPFMSRCRCDHAHLFLHHAHRRLGRRHRNNDFSHFIISPRVHLLTRAVAFIGSP